MQGIGEEELKTYIKTLNASCRIPCPVCGPTRKKVNDKCMSVTVEHDRTIYNCHHCSAAGAVSTAQPIQFAAPRRRKVVPINSFQNKPEIIIKALKSRGIDESVVNHYQLVGDVKYFHGAGELEAIGFVYGDTASPSAIKWRSIDGKHFTQSGSALTLYGIEEYPESETIVICEGEYDALAFQAAGIHALSVPNGALEEPKDGKERVIREGDSKFSFISNAAKHLEAAKKVVLALDKDGPGAYMVKEISRRVDAAKCWTANYPDDCKDANDVLIKHGVDAVVESIEKATPMPLLGVYCADDYEEEFEAMYANGLGRGKSTGYRNLDELMTLDESGHLVIVTGIPGSGKSEFIDQIIINAARLHGWKWAVKSFENPVKFHIAKLSEKVTGKPFFMGFGTRMTPEEAKQAREFISDHIYFLDEKDGALSTIDSIIDRAKQAVMRYGIRGLVIDPYNYLPMTNEDKEHVSISNILSKLSHLAKSHGLLIFFVAHPTKLYEDNSGNTPVPKGNHISGGAAWFAKADFGLTVHRDHQDNVEIHLWKVRFKWLGKVGKCLFEFDLPTGIYTEIQNPYAMRPRRLLANSMAGNNHYLDTISDADITF